MAADTNKVKRVTTSGPLIRVQVGDICEYGATREDALEALAEKLAAALEEKTPPLPSQQGDGNTASLLKSTANATDQEASLASHAVDLPQQSSSSPATCTMPPSPKVQGAECLDLLKLPVQDGETYYVVPKEWLRVWHRYVNGDADAKVPGPIDTVSIASVVDTGRDGLVLTKSDLVVGTDLEIIHSSLWRKLVDWYGCDGPVIRHGVKNGSLLCGYMEIQIGRYHHGNGTLVDRIEPLVASICASRQETIDDLKRAIASKLSIKSVDSFRLWDTFYKTSAVLLDDETKTLQGWNLIPSNPVLVEEVHPDSGKFVLTKQTICLFPTWIKE